VFPSRKGRACGYRCIRTLTDRLPSFVQADLALNLVSGGTAGDGADRKKPAWQTVGRCRHAIGVAHFVSHSRACSRFAAVAPYTGLPDARTTVRHWPSANGTARPSGCWKPEIVSSNPIVGAARQTRPGWGSWLPLGRMAESVDSRVAASATAKRMPANVDDRERPDSEYRSVAPPTKVGTSFCEREFCRRAGNRKTKTGSGTPGG